MSVDSDFVPLFLPGDLLFNSDLRSVSVLEEDDAAQESEDCHQSPHSDGVCPGRLLCQKH